MSHDPELEDRLHQMLEGGLDAGERAKLRAAIARDPALGRHAEELEAAFGALAGARMVEPPAGLRDAVLREIQPAAPARRAASGANWPRLLLPIAAAASALVVLGVLLAPHADRAPGTMPVAGTIGDATPPGASHARIARGDLGTYVLSRVDASHAALAIDAGARPLSVVVRWRAGAVRAATLSSGGPVTRAAEGVTFALPPGARERLDLTMPDSAALRLELDVIDQGREAPIGTVSISPEASTR